MGSYGECIPIILQMMDRALISHCLQTADLAEMVSKGMELDTKLLKVAATVHDIGKIYVAPLILNKEGKLSESEREAVDLHAYYGYRILKEMNVDNRVCNIVIYHHGRDKPALREKPAYTEEVALYAGIIRTVDAYDALTSDRPYRVGYSPAEAISMMKSEGIYRNDIVEMLEKKFI